MRGGTKMKITKTTCKEVTIRDRYDSYLKVSHYLDGINNAHMFVVITYKGKQITLTGVQEIHMLAEALKEGLTVDYLREEEVQ